MKMSANARQARHLRTLSSLLINMCGYEHGFRLIGMIKASRCLNQKSGSPEPPGGLRRSGTFCASKFSCLSFCPLLCAACFFPFQNQRIPDFHVLFRFSQHTSGFSRNTVMPGTDWRGGKGNPRRARQGWMLRTSSWYRPAPRRSFPYRP